MHLGLKSSYKHSNKEAIIDFSLITRYKRARTIIQGCKNALNYSSEKKAIAYWDGIILKFCKEVCQDIGLPILIVLNQAFLEGKIVNSLKFMGVQWFHVPFSFITKFSLSYK